jgi:hypothetical protein
MRLLNHEQQQTTDARIFPQEMTLASSSRTSLLTNQEYIDLLKSSLSNIADRYLQQINPLALSADIVDGAPSNFNIPKLKGVVAQFYVRKNSSFDEVINDLENNQSNNFAKTDYDLDGALVLVRVIKQGNLLYPDVHYSDSQSNLARQIANTFVREVPYLGDLNEIDRINEQKIRSKKYIKIGAAVGAIGLLASISASLINSNAQENILGIERSLNVLSTNSLTLNNINQASQILLTGSVVQKQKALQIIVKWSDSAISNPSYLGRTDDTFTGPLYFTRIVDKALEQEQSPVIRTRLFQFKKDIYVKGEPVIMRQFDEYASIAFSQNGMTAADAKAMSWEHVVIPMNKLTSDSTAKTEQLKISNQLGAIIYSSSKAIPALKNDYRRSIIPRISNIKDPAVRETIKQWTSKI